MPSNIQIQSPKQMAISENQASYVPVKMLTYKKSLSQDKKLYTLHLLFLVSIDFNL